MACNDVDHTERMPEHGADVTSAAVEADSPMDTAEAADKRLQWLLYSPEGGVFLDQSSRQKHREPRETDAEQQQQRHQRRSPDDSGRSRENSATESIRGLHETDDGHSAAGAGGGGGGGASGGRSRNAGGSHWHLDQPDATVSPPPSQPPPLRERHTMAAATAAPAAEPPAAATRVLNPYPAQAERAASPTATSPTAAAAAAPPGRLRAQPPRAALRGRALLNKLLAEVESPAGEYTPTCDSTSAVNCSVLCDEMSACGGGVNATGRTEASMTCSATDGDDADAADVADRAAAGFGNVTKTASASMETNCTGSDTDMLSQNIAPLLITAGATSRRMSNKKQRAKNTCIPQPSAVSGIRSKMQERPVSDTPFLLRFQQHSKVPTRDKKPVIVTKYKNLKWRHRKTRS